MGKKKRIGWDVTHLEFTIADHYYFSGLKAAIVGAGAVVRVVEDLADIDKYDVLVINYPEMPFKSTEVEAIKRYVAAGNRVVAAGYYQNEDKVADNMNTLAPHFGLRLGSGSVRDASSNHGGDDLLLVTSRLERYGAGAVMLPCCAPVRMESPAALPIALKEGARRGRAPRSALAAEAALGAGRFALIGTCVFWDNFALGLYDNAGFAMRLLLDP